MTNTADTTKQEPTLVGIKQCLEIVFPYKEGRPGIRTFNEWRAKGFYPYLKAGKRVYLDPVQVRKALDKRFTIEVID